MLANLLEPGERALFLFCVTALQKLKSASVESQNFITGGELQTIFGLVTEEETEAQRGKGICLRSLSNLVEKSVLELRFPESWFRNLQ